MLTLAGCTGKKTGEPPVQTLPPTISTQPTSNTTLPSNVSVPTIPPSINATVTADPDEQLDRGLDLFDYSVDPLLTGTDAKLPG